MSEQLKNKLYKHLDSCEFIDTPKGDLLFIGDVRGAVEWLKKAISKVSEKDDFIKGRQALELVDLAFEDVIKNEK